MLLYHTHTALQVDSHTHQQPRQGPRRLNTSCVCMPDLCWTLPQFEHIRVDIETCSSLSAGQTVCDVWHQSKLPKNCRVAMKMDVDKFWELMLAAIEAADAAAPMNKGWRSLTTGQEDGS